MVAGAAVPPTHGAGESHHCIFRITMSLLEACHASGPHPDTHTCSAYGALGRHLGQVATLPMLTLLPVSAPCCACCTHSIYGPGYGYGWGWARMPYAPMVPNERRMEDSNDRRFAMLMNR